MLHLRSIALFALIVVTSLAHSGGASGANVAGGIISAQGATTAGPRIVAMRVSHTGTTLPASGARVTTAITVSNATRCVFYRQTAPNSALHAFHTASCVSGRASATAPAVRNRTQSRVQFTYAVRVIRGGASVERQTTLHEAAALAPKPTASLSLSPQSLSYSGGQVTASYSSSNATSCSLATSPSLLSSSPLSVPCNGNTQLAGIGISLAGAQWSVTFTATGATGATTATQTLREQAPSFEQSANWSGYVMPSNSIITNASGTFTVPTLDCTQTPDAREATWVGIGGVEYSNGSSSGDLLQTGVRSVCAGGVEISNAAWWEEFPEVAEVGFAGLPVSPGDEIEASVYEWGSGAHWETCVDDRTTGLSGLMVTGEGWGVTTGGCTGTFVLQGSAASIDYFGGYTAEWIVEDEGVSLAQPGVYEPFADYGTLTFSNLTANVSSWSLTSNEARAIVQNGSILSAPSAPSGDGFSVSYTG
jgi:hypothetical protein